MPLDTQAKRFDALLQSSETERTRVRSLVAHGQWKQGEKVAARAAAYFAKSGVTPRNALESVTGDTVDYLSASFLSEGARVSRCIGFVELNLGTESRMGTGFLISGGLFITNQHVIGNAQEALSAVVTFDRELGQDNFPLQTTSFRLDPQRFFLASPEAELDFAVVAIGARMSGVASVSDLGFSPLNPEGNKHVMGMNVNIIQHPKGYYKQVALRNNLLTFRTDRALLYETDTEVGSSGSPVYNDRWEVVALHHYGEPYVAKLDVKAAANIPTHANEGIRASVLHAALQGSLPTLDAAQQALLNTALQAYQTVPSRGNTSLCPGNGGPAAGMLLARGRLTPPRGQPLARQSFSPSMGMHASPFTTEENAPMNSSSTINTTASNGTFVSLSVPLEITVRLGAQAGLQGAMAAQAQALLAPFAFTARAARFGRAAEAVKVDTDYANRTGYAPDFIKGAKLPLPKLGTALAKQVAPLRASEPSATSGLLKYEHFSLKMHKIRRVAVFTATNIDGDTYKAVERGTGLVNATEGDTWFKDPRISESFFLGTDFYASTSNYFDRGHLTRRSDPTWGSAQEAERANADTFHLSNCSPQHFRFNESAQYWQGLERYILETGVLKAGPGSRLCVFQGPLYDNNIDWWVDDEIQIPSSYWKVVVWKGAKGLRSVGLVADQLQLLSESRVALGQPQDVPRVEVSQWRVHVQDIGKRTGLIFDPAIVAADTIGKPVQPQPGKEAAVGTRIRRLEDILL